MPDDTQCRATWWRGCKWGARYDAAPDAGMAECATEHMRYGRFLLANDATCQAQRLVSKTYIRDVCARCGAVKERNNAR